jgi:hypothetical protein
MGPGEAIAILSLFIGLPWVVFSGIAKVKAAGSTTLPSGRGSSEIRKSELAALIEASVEEATAPLVRRVEVLEALLTDEDEAFDRIDPAVLSGVLDLDSEAEEEWEMPEAPRRARS